MKKTPDHDPSSLPPEIQSKSEEEILKYLRQTGLPQAITGPSQRSSNTEEDYQRNMDFLRRVEPKVFRAYQQVVGAGKVIERAQQELLGEDIEIGEQVGLTKWLLMIGGFHQVHYHDQFIGVAQKRLGLAREKQNKVRSEKKWDHFENLISLLEYLIGEVTRTVSTIMPDYATLPTPNQFNDLMGMIMFYARRLQKSKKNVLNPEDFGVMLTTMHQLLNEEVRTHQGCLSHELHGVVFLLVNSIYLLPGTRSPGRLTNMSQICASTRYIVNFFIAYRKGTMDVLVNVEHPLHHLAKDCCQLLEEVELIRVDDDSDHIPNHSNMLSKAYVESVVIQGLADNVLDVVDFIFAVYNLYQDTGDEWWYGFVQTLIKQVRRFEFGYVFFLDEFHEEDIPNALPPGRENHVTFSELRSLCERLKILTSSNYLEILSDKDNINPDDSSSTDFELGLDAHLGSGLIKTIVVVPTDEYSLGNRYVQFVVSLQTEQVFFELLDGQPQDRAIYHRTVDLVYMALIFYEDQLVKQQAQKSSKVSQPFDTISDTVPTTKKKKIRPQPREEPVSRKRRKIADKQHDVEPESDLDEERTVPSAIERASLSALPTTLVFSTKIQRLIDKGKKKGARVEMLKQAQTIVEMCADGEMRKLLLSGPMFTVSGPQNQTVYRIRQKNREIKCRVFAVNMGNGKAVVFAVNDRKDAYRAQSWINDLNEAVSQVI